MLLQVMICLWAAIYVCAAAENVATARPGPQQAITIVLTDTQTILLVGIACWTFMAMLAVLLDVTIFSREYQRRHGRLLERMTNLIHARTQPGRQPSPQTAYVTTAPNTDCTIAITAPTS